LLDANGDIFVREEETARCISHAKEHALRIAKELEAGRDRLLEHHSFNPADAAAVTGAIRQFDEDPAFRSLILDLFKAYGMIVEEFSTHTYKLHSPTLLDEIFPGLSDSRPVVTFDRMYAASREDMEFMTPDHPAVRGGTDMFLGSGKGNAVIAYWKGGSTQRLLLEVVFCVGYIAPSRLLVERFLPPEPVTVIVDHNLADCTGALERSGYRSLLTACPSIPLLDNPEKARALLSGMHAHAFSVATRTVGEGVARGLATMRSFYDSEISRLKALREINPAVRSEEIEDTLSEMREIEDVIRKAQPRLEAVRLIWQAG
jgi:ATP-dependent helicase HepA